MNEEVRQLVEKLNKLLAEQETVWCLEEEVSRLEEELNRRKAERLLMNNIHEDHVKSLRGRIKVLESTEEKLLARLLAIDRELDV